MFTLVFASLKITALTNLKPLDYSDILTIELEIGQGCLNPVVAIKIFVES